MTFLFSSDQGLDTLPAKRQDFTRTPIMARLFNDTMMSFASCLIPALFGIVCLSAPSVKLDDGPSDLEEMPKEIVNFADLSEYALFKAKLIAKPTS